MSFNVQPASLASEKPYSARRSCRPGSHKVVASKLAGTPAPAVKAAASVNAPEEDDEAIKPPKAGPHWAGFRMAEDLSTTTLNT